MALAGKVSFAGVVLICGCPAWRPGTQLSGLYCWTG